ncbi:molybdopterin-binding protein [Paracoccus litorisediminis]|uniref:molybdopterin-binding protein n=1 Tax=Paracoccus litorisediminis TaxID=2006130 RepID=UPI003731F08D
MRHSLELSRRRLLGVGAAGLSTLALSGCGNLDFLGNDGSARNFLARANSLTYRIQRALAGNALAPEYAETEIRQGQRPNGSRDPSSPEYLTLKAADFVDYRLTIDGLVDRPLSLSLSQLQNMPSRTQITRHDCVEGWSCIAKWTGTPLAFLLDQAGVQPSARFVVFHCFDDLGSSRSGPSLYYESCDLIDARHPQTIAAYGLNGRALPVANGAPLRIRVERALGYKQPKYVHRIELVSSFSKLGGGKGGYWEDRGYDWFGGI